MRKHTTVFGSVITLAICHAASVQAVDRFFFDETEKERAKNFYLGATAGSSYAVLKGEYKRNFRPWLPSANFYLGLKLHPYFALELGRNASITKKKNVSFHAGTRYGHIIANTNSQVSSKIFMASFYLDAKFFWPVHPSIQPHIDLGLGLYRGTFGMNSIAPNNSNVSTLFNIQRRSSYVPRLSLGLDWRFSEHCMTGLQLGYQGLSRVKVRDLGGLFGERPFKAGYSAMLAFAAYF
jgi:hypothetical protein